MTQPLWYLRHEGKVYGPFPRPQIETALEEGDITRDWEISLDEADWIGIGESGQFSASPAAPAAAQADSAGPAWREERLRARQRWLDQGDRADVVEPHDSALDAEARQAVAEDHARTEALLRLRQNRDRRVGGLCRRPDRPRQLARLRQTWLATARRAGAQRQTRKHPAR